MTQEEKVRHEIHSALDRIAPVGPDLLPSIRQRLAARPATRRLRTGGQVAVVLGLAVVVAFVGLSAHRARVNPGRVNTSPAIALVTGPGASNTWVSSYATPGATIVTGIDPSGHIVGRINAPVDLRSRDGAHLYALQDHTVEVFSALDGHHESSIRLQHASGTGLEMLSADGPFLVVSDGSPATVELIDLTQTRSVAMIRLDAPGYVTPVMVGDAPPHIYLFGDSVTDLTFDGTQLTIVRRSPANPAACDGLVVGGENSAGGLPFRILADGKTLVAFCPGDGTITWFDLAALKVIHTITVPHANPFWVAPVFSADRRTLYLHEGGTGALTQVDLVHQRVTSSAKVALKDVDPLAWLSGLVVMPAYAGGIPRTATLSPDGNWLYAVSIFGGPRGVFVVHLPDLRVRAKWLASFSFDTVWAEPDGRTISVLSQDTNTLRILRADGSDVATIALPAHVDGFIVPTVP